MRQEYVLSRERNPDGGRAAAAGFRGVMTPEAMVKMLLEGDKNGDGKLAKEEMTSVLRGSFREHDVNQDAILDRDEIEALAKEQTQFLPSASRRRGSRD